MLFNSVCLFCLKVYELDGLIPMLEFCGGGGGLRVGGGNPTPLSDQSYSLTADLLISQ